MHKQAIAILIVVTVLTYYQLNDNHAQQSPQTNKIKMAIKSLDINFNDLFNEWKSMHNKAYGSQEEQKYRCKIFISNCRKIYNHNRNRDMLGYSYSYGLNQFSDMTKQEYINSLTTYSSRGHFRARTQKSQLLNLTLQCTGTITLSPNPPDEVDWTKKAVTPVMNQGQCGSSYAMSAVGAIQGLFALRIGKLEQFSVQQIVDCSGGYGNEGCSGGFMDQAFWYIIDNGLATTKTYPLKNTTNKCTFTKSMKATSISKCADIPSGNYSKLQSAVIQQPASVAIDASQLQHYESGIYNGNCSSSYINQAMLVVGYGEEDNQTYWKIKNSLGSTWGESGYLLLQRSLQDGPGKCGIQLVPAVPQSIA